MLNMETLFASARLDRWAQIPWWIPKFSFDFCFSVQTGITDLYQQCLMIANWNVIKLGLVGAGYLPKFTWAPSQASDEVEPEEQAPICNAYAPESDPGQLLGEQVGSSNGSSDFNKSQLQKSCNYKLLFKVCSCGMQGATTPQMQSDLEWVAWFMGTYFPCKHVIVLTLFV